MAYSSRTLDKSSFLRNIETLLLQTLEVVCLTSPLGFDTRLVSGVGVQSLGLSSIDYVDFLVSVEDYYDVIFDFDTMLYTIDDIYNYVYSYNQKYNEDKK